MPATRATVFTLLVFSLSAVGCDSGASKLPEGKAERAAVIAKEVKASPDAAEEILDKYEMTADDFEALMFEIAEDPELSDTYTKALEE